MIRIWKWLIAECKAIVNLLIGYKPLPNELTEFEQQQLIEIRREKEAKGRVKRDCTHKWMTFSATHMRCAKCRYVVSKAKLRELDRNK